jgi:hypothetical protein
MSRGTFQKSPVLESAALRDREINTKITIVANTTDASIKAYSDLGSAVTVYKEGDTVSDSDAQFGTLDTDAAPGVFGVLVNCQDAFRINKIEVPVDSISSATMTAGVVAWKGGGDGVTSSNNIAFTVSCTNLDPDADTATTTFNLVIKYKAL